jgi:hypothetical protein
MKKKNVFVVTFLPTHEPDGAVVERILCSMDETSVREFGAKTMPDMSIIGVTGLEQLEARVKKIRDVLGGTDTSMDIVIDPALQ